MINQMYCDWSDFQGDRESPAWFNGEPCGHSKQYKQVCLFTCSLGHLM